MIERQTARLLSSQMMNNTDPAKNLRDAYRAVNPALPLAADDPRYVDCNDVRGHEDVVTQMFKAISYSDEHSHQLFTGHRGCGKSTELLRLQARLEAANFHVIYFVADEDLDTNDLVYTDLLLAIARRIEEDFRNAKIDLSDALKTVETWFAEVVYQQSDWSQIHKQLETEASLGIGLPSSVPLIARILAKFTGQIKTGDEIKTEIRRKLDQQISQLIEHINTLLYQAFAAINKRGKQGIVILIDNLDRITLKEIGPGITSHDALFIDHGRQLCDLKCHVVYTVPISMIYSPKATQLRNSFPAPAIRILPMIKVHEPRAQGSGDFEPGLERLRGILNQRMALDDLAEPEAITYLCRASGGHPRDLMALIRQTIEYVDDEHAQPIKMDHARRGEAKLVSAFSRMVPEAHFEKLARVYLTNEIQNDEDHQLMLFNQSVLEYAGDDESGDKSDPEPWHDVHPAVQQLSRFKKALDKAQGDERAKSLIK